MKSLYKEIALMIKRNEFDNIKNIISIMPRHRVQELMSTTDDGDWTLLFHAVTESNTDPRIVQLLVDSGTPLDHFDAHGNTAIFFVERSEFGEILKKAGADVHIKNNWLGTTALFGCYSPTMVDTMLKLGINPNAENNEGSTALFYFETSENPKDNLAMEKLLLDAGANPDHINCYGEVPLMMVKSIDTAALLVEYGADLNYVDKEGLSVVDVLKKKGIAHVAEWAAKCKSEQSMKNAERGSYTNCPDFM